MSDRNKGTAATSQTTAVATTNGRPSLVQRLALKYDVDPTKMLSTLKATAFKSEKEVSDEQMMALLIVAEQYDLNPWIKQIYAYPDKYKGITAVVGVDGWIHMINTHPNFESMELELAPHEPGEIPEWCECRIQRNDRTKPTVVREYYEECKRNTEPWNTMPRRMLRHKSIIQCGRVAFGFSGVHDPDEAERIREINVTPVTEPTGAPKSKALPDKPALINAGQEQLLLRKMSDAGMDQETFLTRFSIKAISELAFDRMSEALAFIADPEREALQSQDEG